MTTTQQHQDQINAQDTLWEVPDELWIRLAPVLVIDKPRKKSGRPPRDARAIFNGLIWLARTGSQWSQLPRRYGPKSTVHERFTAWVEHGCLRAAWAIVLEEYDQELGIDWEWQAADGSIVKAPLGKRGLSEPPKRRAAIPPTEAKQAVNARC
ncbi:transposase [Deinococcus sp.]|uniref:transposase n=1 Tax=Deinococcus sp. TaxID=47478 RepID=UPI0025B9723F|nr:transposase [Deinococcus sp.]